MGISKLILFPFNGNAIEALDCIDDSKYMVIGFVDDSLEKLGKQFAGINVYDRNLFDKEPQAKVLAVPGSPSSYLSRDKIINGLPIDPIRFATIIHPMASVSKFAKVGSNSLVMEGVVIKASAIIGDNVCILPNSVVHHDSIVKKNTLIGSNVSIAGNTTIRENCYLGSGTRVINGITIAKGTLIGLGTNVVKSINIPNSKVIGNPAREL